MIEVILILLILPSLLLTIDFVKFIFTGKRLYNTKVLRTIEFVAMIVLPVFYLGFFDIKTNECCGSTTSFSPDHKLTIYIWICICILAYFYSSLRNDISTPIVEVLTNSLLLFGLIFNIFICIHLYKQLQALTLLGNLPIGILFIFQLIDNHKKNLKTLSNYSNKPKSYFQKIAYRILHQNIFLKVPILIILCIPILIIITSLLLLFGQKPNSLIKAYTDTYFHGFSELDHLCDNVQCGGHFLCSVAAKGHYKVVKPIRYGERNGKKIICNRQLLIANAFEELIEQKFPRTHNIIRHQYNKVGNTIHKHYHIFNNKFISDTLYIIMKPLEVFFLLTLYTFDKQPEDRIAIQYLKKTDRNAVAIKSAISN